jgi:hypothetical protein
MFLKSSRGVTLKSLNSYFKTKGVFKFNQLSLLLIRGGAKPRAY